MLNWSELFLLIFFLIITIPLLGKYMALVFRERQELQIPVLSHIENLIYKICGINSAKEMHWKEYLCALLLFNAAGFLTLFAVLSFQESLPLNPQQFPNIPPALAFNMSSSFVTNTGWQMYQGENTLSYFTQMIGLTTQYFLSPASGLAALLTLIRGFTRRAFTMVGNFWKDIVRTVVYLFLPICLLFSCIYVSQGVIQTLSDYVKAETLEGEKQTIPLGLVASQVVMNHLGSNGGGFFSTNSTHPFENPTDLTNFLGMFLILLVPASTIYMYGELIHSLKQARILFASLLLLWAASILLSFYAEKIENPVQPVNPVLEGIETRFRGIDHLIWTTTTTVAVDGASNRSLSSLSSLETAIAMFNVLLNGLIFGSVGTGLSQLLLYILLGVILGGVMIGRTPEYMGKQLEGKETALVMFALLFSSFMIYLGLDLTILLPGSFYLENHLIPEYLTEKIFTLTSLTKQNSSMVGYDLIKSPFTEVTSGLMMLLTRYAFLSSCVAIGGIFALKKPVSITAGSLKTDNFLFVFFVIFLAFLITILIFFSLIVLGPIMEHLVML